LRWRHFWLCAKLSDEKLHQNSVFDFGGSDLHQRFCGRAYSAKLQKNR
jgi:hypothetical protein